MQRCQREAQALETKTLILNETEINNIHLAEQFPAGK